MNLSGDTFVQKNGKTYVDHGDGNLRLCTTWGSASSTTREVVTQPAYASPAPASIVVDSTVQSFVPFDVPGVSQEVQQVVQPRYTEWEVIDVSPRQSYQPTGGGFGVREGIGIATSLLPLIALFGGKGKSKDKAPRQPIQAQIRRASPLQRDQPMDERTKLLLLGGGALAILGIGILVMSK